MISPIVPSETAHESAGEQLAAAMLSVLSSTACTTVVSTITAANTRSLERGTSVEHVLLPAANAPQRNRVLRALTVELPAHPVALNAHRSLLASADIFDLQWQESGALIPYLRSVNPRAQIVVTLHDVLSQRFARERAKAPTSKKKLLARARWGAAKWLERKIARQADDVLVLSEKDGALLPTWRSGARLHVLRPPIHGALREQRVEDTVSSPKLLFVGYMRREENIDALLWFSSEVLPAIRERFPDVRVVVAGGGTPRDIGIRLSQAGIDVLGYVQDLEPLYTDCTAVIAPLRLGAGVKFKVVEALTRGIPVITTSVGAEGIPPSPAMLVGDDASSFGGQVTAVLDRTEEFDSLARAHAETATRDFGLDDFRKRLQLVYSQGPLHRGSRHFH